MRAALSHPQQTPYYLTEDLRDEGILLGLPRTTLSEGERDDLLYSKLGQKGWGRLHHFRNYYASGWGEGAGKPVSPRAMENLYRFLESATFPPKIEPSVFLTAEGYIELSWEDASGKAIQAEFRSTDIEIYIEAKGVEESVPSTRVHEVAKRLAA